MFNKSKLYTIPTILKNDKSIYYLTNYAKSILYKIKKFITKYTWKRLCPYNSLRNISLFK